MIFALPEHLIALHMAGSRDVHVGIGHSRTQINPGAVWSGSVNLPISTPILQGQELKIHALHSSDSMPGWIAKELPTAIMLYQVLPPFWEAGDPWPESLDAET
jgi:hypothetical protein